jgi:hypothetical protein
MFEVIFARVVGVGDVERFVGNETRDVFLRGVRYVGLGKD